MGSNMSDTVRGDPERQPPLNRLNELVLWKRGVTPDTALRLGRFPKTSPQPWMRLQADWDLQQAMLREGRKAS